MSLSCQARNCPHHWPRDGSDPSTPEAWLSTWSGLSSNADFLRCAPGVTIPTLFIELTGDQAAFPAYLRQMIDALGAEDLSTATVRSLHFGGPITHAEPTGNELAATEIINGLSKRHELTPPAWPSFHGGRRSGAA